MKHNIQHSLLKSFFCFIILFSLTPAVPLAKILNDTTLVFVGNVILQSGDNKRLKNFAGDFHNDLQQANIAIGNLGCVASPFGTRTEFPNVFRADREAIPVLKKYFYGLSIANDSSMGFGQTAMLDMVANSKKNGLHLFGAGANLTEAYQPLVIRINGKIIVIISFSLIGPRSFEALHTQPGVAWFDGDLIYQTLFSIKKHIKPDLIIAMPHWGLEEEKNPTHRQRHLAKTLFDYGVDVIIGTHPKVTQKIESIYGKPVFYSLGNFSADNYNLNLETRKSFMLKLVLDQNNKLDWTIQHITLDKDGIPRKTMDHK